MNKIIIFIIYIILIIGCSLNKNSKFWTTAKNIPKENNNNYKEVFIEEEVLAKELNANISVNLGNNINDNFNIKNYFNNDGRLNYDGELKKSSKFKFSKIKNFYHFEPTISFNNENLIFFDNKGSILQFNEESKLIWKRNFYSKSEKKHKPILQFANDKNILIVADSIAKYYSLNINNGDLIWSKNHSSAFNSEIKIFGENFFISDLNNLFMSISIKNGVENWRFQSEDFFIKTLNKASVVADNKTVYFLNTIGDLTALDIKSGFLKWQISNQNNNIFDKHFLNKNSKLLMDNQLILYSSKNDFYAFDKRNGFLKWKQKIQTTIAPTVIDENLLIISLNGFFVVVDSVTGIIKRSNFIFTDFNKKELK